MRIACCLVACTEQCVGEPKFGVCDAGREELVLLKDTSELLLERGVLTSSDVECELELSGEILVARIIL